MAYKAADQIRGSQLVAGRHSVEMKLLILSMLLATAAAAPAAQSLTFHDDGSYRFYYETGKEGGSHSRSEVRNPDGVVIGKFSYEDPDGELREVSYRADGGGFVAQGDVGVKGAPKGQFPVLQDNQAGPEPDAAPTTAVDNEPAEPNQEDNRQQQSGPLVMRSPQIDSHHDEGQDRDEMQDLSLEESSSDDPPEAFPPGFFLNQFHGLRRLPEPTQEDNKPATTEAPKEDDKQAPPEDNEVVNEEVNNNKEPEEPPAPEKAPVPVEGSVFSFAPIKPPFPARATPHQEWANAMFHQPVYVFAYHQPDSYGYHYYF